MVINTETLHLSLSLSLPYDLSYDLETNECNLRLLGVSMQGIMLQEEGREFKVQKSPAYEVIGVGYEELPEKYACFYIVVFFFGKSRLIRGQINQTNQTTNQSINQPTINQPNSNQSINGTFNRENIQSIDTNRFACLRCGSLVTLTTTTRLLWKPDDDDNNNNDDDAGRSFVLVTVVLS